MSHQDYKLQPRTRYICNKCGYVHDSYWKDFDHCMDEDCMSKNITKVDLSTLVEEEFYENEEEEVKPKSKRGRKKR